MKRIIILSLFLMTLEAQTLVLGVIPRYNLNQIRDQWEPLVEKVYKKTGIKIVLRTQKDVTQFLKAYLSGKYDLVYANPGHYALAHQAQGYEAILSEDKVLRGMIVSSNKNREITVEDLKGRSLAFPSSSAFAATVMPRVEIYERYGFDITKKAPSYVGTLQKSMLMAKQEKSFAAGTAFDVFNRAAASFKAGLQTVYITKPAASHPLSIHPRVSSEDREHIVNAFLSINASELKGLALESIKEVKDKDYDYARELLEKNTLLDAKK